MFIYLFIDGPTQVYKESCENPISTIALSEKSIVAQYLECRLGVNYLKLVRKDVKVKRNNENFSFRLLWRFKFAFFTSAVLMLKGTFSIWTNLGNCKHLLFVCFMCLWYKRGFKVYDATAAKTFVNLLRHYVSSFNSLFATTDL